MCGSAIHSMSADSRTEGRSLVHSHYFQCTESDAGLKEILSLATEQGSTAMIPKQRPSQQFGKLLYPYGQRKLIKFEVRQKYCSQMFF
jgi:hypothetical protein